MLEKFKSDIINAMKEKDKVKLNTLRSVKGAMELEKINNKKEENDDLLLDAVNKQIKLRNDSIKEFETAGRMDLVNSYKQEIDILKEYMPKELTNEEIEKIVDDAINKLGVNDMKGLGLVMKEITPTIKNRCDMKSVTEMVKSKLN